MSCCETGCSDCVDTMKRCDDCHSPLTADEERDVGGLTYCLPDALFAMGVDVLDAVREVA